MLDPKDQPEGGGSVLYASSGPPHPWHILCAGPWWPGQVQGDKVDLSGGNQGLGRGTAEPDAQLQTVIHALRAQKRAWGWGWGGIRQGFSREVTFKLKFSGYIKKCA